MRGEVSRLVIRVFAISIGLACAMALAGFVIYGPRTALSVGAGLVVSMASFGVLVGLVHRSLSGCSGVGMGLMVGLGLVKLAIIGAVLWWLVSRGMVGPMAFMAGFSAMVVSLVFEGLRSGRRREGEG